MNLVVFGGIGSFFRELWSTLMLWINNMIYNAIELFYKVFTVVANTNLFSDEVFKDITSRVYVIMGIAMLFIFAYNIVLMIINPEDKKGTGQTTKFVKEVMISLVLIILLPTIFNYMAIIQRHILDSNILSQIIVGDSGGTLDECNYNDYTLLNNYNIDVYHSNASATQSLTDACNDYNSEPSSVRGARSVIPTLFAAFYHPVDYGFYECQEFVEGRDTGKITKDEDKEMCAHYYYVIRMSTFKGSINPINDDSKFFSNAQSKDDSFEFNWILSLIAGGLAAYMFMSYAMAVGVRIAKLGFLQIVSPIAVMMRLIPKQKEAMYDKWFKNLTETYLDVFIRLIIIYFSFFAISLVPDIMDKLSVNADGQPIVWALAKAVVILGVLKFAGDSPALIKEFFGNSGKYALKSPKKQFEENKLATKGAGMIASGIGSAAVGFTRNFNRSKGSGFGKVMSGTKGLFGGLYHGSKNGLKNGVKDLKGSISSAADTVEKKRQTYNARRAMGGNNYFRGLYNEKIDNARRNFVDFKDYMTGNVASAATGDAAKSIMNSIESMENDFSNANIANIKSGRSEIMKKFNADQDFEFNGKKYHKINDNEWTDGTKDALGNYIPVATHGALGKQIVDSYKSRLANAYADNEWNKPGIKEGFERANESMMSDLRKSMSQLGSDFSDRLFKNLNQLKDANGNNMNLNITSFDDLENKVKDLMKSEKGRADIYMINDEIKSIAKGLKLDNEQAIKAEQAKKDSKKSDSSK